MDKFNIAVVLVLLIIASSGVVMAQQAGLDDVEFEDEVFNQVKYTYTEESVKSFGGDCIKEGTDVPAPEGWATE